MLSVGDLDQGMFVSIKEASRILNVSQPTLRRWEKQGKIEPPERSPGGRRMYDLRKLMDMLAACNDESEEKSAVNEGESGPEQKEQKKQKVDKVAASGLFQRRTGKELQRMIEAIESGAEITGLDEASGYNHIKSFKLQTALSQLQRAMGILDNIEFLENQALKKYAESRDEKTLEDTMDLLKYFKNAFQDMMKMLDNTVKDDSMINLFLQQINQNTVNMQQNNYDDQGNRIDGGADSIEAPSVNKLDVGLSKESRERIRGLIDEVVDVVASKQEGLHNSAGEVIIETEGEGDNIGGLGDGSD